MLTWTTGHVLRECTSIMQLFIGFDGLILMGILYNMYRCVEIGSGSGYVVCSVAQSLSQLCQCFATDINASACAATHETIRNHDMNGRVDVVHCDVASPLEDRLKHGVDLVVFNPPYVVTPDDEVEGDGISAAWAGGLRGRRIIDKVLPKLSLLLSPGGIVYMIAIHDNDPAGT